MTNLLDGGLTGWAAQVAIGLGVGLPLGFAHFAGLRWNSGFYLDRRPILGLAIQVLRFGVLAGALFALTRLGAGALMAGALGVFVARRFVVRRAGGLP